MAFISLKIQVNTLLRLLRKTLSPVPKSISKKIIESAEQTEEFEEANIEKIYREYAEQNDIKIALIIHPTRISLVGDSKGPGLFDLMKALGKETCLRRMKALFENYPI